MDEVLTRSPVLAEAIGGADFPPPPDYAPDEIAYLRGLQARLERARIMRDKPHDEFDGMTYVEWWESNERGANTFLEPKRNREDSNFQSGTIRNKLLALLAALLNLDLSPDVSAFDENDMEIQRLGEAIEDVIEKTEELDNDTEKKTRRQYELLKQGDAFVEEIWDEQFIKDKRLKGSKTFDGKVAGVTWTTKMKRMFSRPSRNIINGLSMFLGDITQYEIGKQPFIFTVDVKGYEETKARYGDWERWINVSKDLKPIAPGLTRSIIYNNWRLTQIEKNHCEVIRYQDKWNNEFAIVINGVLMTPVGLPFPWGYNDYNIAQQGFEPIHEKFAYHASLVKRIRLNVIVLDEMIRLAVLKTQKSFMPARFNLTGRVVSRRVFMPGAITLGIDPRQVPTADAKETEGVTAGEFNLIHQLLDTIDKQTVNPVFSGQTPAGNPTATEILEVQRQAKLMLGLAVGAASLLEWKLAHLRVYNILKNWFEPIDDKLDEVRKEIVNKYRITNVARPIEGVGQGRRVTVPTDQLPTPQDVFGVEEAVTEKTGIPHRFIFIDPNEFEEPNRIWQINVTAREKRTSEISKMLFSGMAKDAIALFGPDVNTPYLEEDFATVWDKDPRKLFKRAAPPPPGGPPGGAPPAPLNTPPAAQGITPPSPQAAMGKSLQSTLSQ